MQGEGNHNMRSPFATLLPARRALTRGGGGGCMGRCSPSTPKSLTSYNWASDCSRSAQMSSTFSTPMLKRIRLSLMPSSARLSGPWSQ